MKVALRRPACKSALREMFDRNSVVANLKETLAVGLCRAAAVPGGGDDVDPDGLAAAIAEAASVMEPDYDELTLSGLSVLETALMVAAKVVHASRDEQQFNFEQVGTSPDGSRPVTRGITNPFNDIRLDLLI